MPASLRSDALSSPHGDTGHHPMDSVAAIPWTGWPPSRGLGGSDPVDSVAAMRGIRIRIGRIGLIGRIPLHSYAKLIG